MVGFFYYTNRYSDELVYGPKISETYNLRLAIGVIGEEPAENVQVKIDVGEPYSEYNNIIDITATISADNYDEVSVAGKASFYDEENCQFALQLPVRLVRNREDTGNGVFLADDLENTMSLSSTGNGSIEPGSDNICEVILPCGFTSESLIFSETNQPPQPRFNVSTDNPKIGDEATNSAWVTDENESIISSLEADHTYAAHIYVRVSGPEAATGVTIRSSTIDNEEIDDYQTWYLDSYIQADNARRFKHDVGYSVRTNLRLQYVTGSLLLHREGQEDIALNPTTFFQDGYSADGTKIGTAGLDGVIAPGLESACEITYQFKTVDLEAEKAAKQAEKETEKAEEVEESSLPIFSDKCSVWLTNDKGSETKVLGNGNTYTVHTQIRIAGEGRAEGVKISNSDLSAISLDGNDGTFYLKVTADNLEEKILSAGLTRSRGTDEVLSLQYVKGSLQVKSAAGVYKPSNDEFFDYGSGCLIGFSGADGVIPAGSDTKVEVTYQIEVTSGDNKSGLKTGKIKFFGNPIVTAILIVLVVVEQIMITYMANHPDNRLARRAARRRRFFSTLKDSWVTARAELRRDKATESDDAKTN